MTQRDGMRFLSESETEQGEMSESNHARISAGPLCLAYVRRFSRPCGHRTRSFPKMVIGAGGE